MLGNPSTLIEYALFGHLFGLWMTCVPTLRVFSTIAPSKSSNGAITQRAKPGKAKAGETESWGQWNGVWFNATAAEESELQHVNTYSKATINCSFMYI